MIKIKYPTDLDFKEEFKQEIIKSKSIAKAKIDTFLEDFKIGKTFDELLILPLEHLIDLPKIEDDEIKNIYNIITDEELKKKKKEIATWFNYKSLQKGALSIFFMKYAEIINLKSCCYCNLDFINVFVGLENEYFDKFDIINNHKSKKELELITGIGKGFSDELSNLKGRIYDENDFNELIEDPRLKKILNNLFNRGNLDIKKLKLHNHFTLDHLLPQKDYPYLSLSLYNLVPSCYSCNSKLKKEKNLYFDINDLKILSPTCTPKGSNIGDFLEFKILYDNSFSNLNLPNTKNKYKIKILSKFDEYLNVLRLQGRYNFHKNISFEMIEKRKNYPDTQIDEIEKLFLKNKILIDKETFKKQIFGSVIFEKENTNEPFEKYKKDIAKQLGII